MSLSVAAAYLIPVLLALWIGHVADKRSLSRAMVSAATSVAMAMLIVAGVNAPGTMIAVVLLVTSMAAPITQGAANTALLHELVNPDQIGLSLIHISEP